MSHRHRALLFALCLIWQALSALLPAALDARTDAIGHAVVHDMAVGHHHHDDASLHLTETDEAAHQHVLDGGQPAALVLNVAGIDPAVPAGGLRSDEVLLPESASLEGPLRPPRSPRV